MVYDYIALGASGLFLLLSLVSVITEPLLNRDSNTGRAFRKLRINMREVGFLLYILITGTVLTVGRLIHRTSFISSGMKYLWIAAGVFAAAAVMLHWYRVFRPLRSRRSARAKTPVGLTGRTGIAGNAGVLPVLPEARELRPLEVTVSDDN